MNTTERRRVPSPSEATTATEPSSGYVFTEAYKQYSPPAVAQEPKLDSPAAQVVTFPQPNPWPMTPFANITTAIANVMSEVGVVAKEGENSFHHYKYATMGDLLQRLTPLMGKHGLVVMQNEVSKQWVNQRYVSVTYEFTVAHKSGEVWPERVRFTGMSLAETKNGFDDKCLNKAAVAARKYFLLTSLFQIPTGDVDDADAGDRVPDSAARPVNQGRATAPSPTQSGKSVKPHLISGKGLNAQTWANAYYAAMSKSESVADLEAWDRANDHMLKTLKAERVDLYDKIVNTWNSLIDKRSREAVKPSASGNGSAGTSSPTPSPGAATPQITVDPKAFLDWLENQMKAFANLAVAQDWWNAAVAPQIDAAETFPPDREEALAIWQRFEQRLAQ